MADEDGPSSPQPPSEPSGPGGGVNPAGGGPGSAVSVVGDVVQHVAAGQEAAAEFAAAADVARESIDINILSPSKVPVSYR